MNMVNSKHTFIGDHSIQIKTSYLHYDGFYVRFSGTVLIERTFDQHK